MSQEPNAIHPSLHAVVDCQALQVSQVGCGIRRKQLILSCNCDKNADALDYDTLSCAKVKKKSKLRLTSFWCNSMFCLPLKVQEVALFCQSFVWEREGGTPSFWVSLRRELHSYRTPVVLRSYRDVCISLSFEEPQRIVWCSTEAEELQVSGSCINSFTGLRNTVPTIPMAQLLVGRQHRSPPLVQASYNLVFFCPNPHDSLFFPADTVFHGTASLQHSGNAIQIIPALWKHHIMGVLVSFWTCFAVGYCRPEEPSAILRLNTRRTFNMIRID